MSISAGSIIISISISGCCFRNGTIIGISMVISAGPGALMRRRPAGAPCVPCAVSTAPGDVVERGRQPRQQLLAGFRRRDAARRAIEQAHVEAFFQRAQPLAEARRRRSVASRAARRKLRVRATAAKAAEIAQIVAFHLFT